MAGPRQKIIEALYLLGHPVLQSALLGASTRDPTHDKVMRRRPDKRGRLGLQEFRKAAPALTLKMISVFLMLAILDYSLFSVTQGEGLPHLSPNRINLEI